MVKITGSQKEGQDVTIAARVTGDDFRPIAPEDVISWSLSIFDLSSEDSDEAIYTLTSQTAPIISELIVDSYWPDDLIGRNFLYRVPRVNFGGYGGRRYQFIWDINTYTYGHRIVDADVTIIPTGPV